MKKQSILSRIYHSIKLFFSTLIGYQNNKYLLRIVEMIEELNRKSSERFAQLMELGMKNIFQVNRLNEKYFFPVLMNNKGRAINLSGQRDFKTEITLAADRKNLNCTLIINREDFERFSLDLEASYIEHPARPLILFALEKVRDKEKKEYYLDNISRFFLMNLIQDSFRIGLLVSKEIREILGQSILEVIKPDYIKENDLKDFDINSGPVEKEKKEKEA